MILLVVSATPFEISPFEEYLKKNYIQSGSHRYLKGPLDIRLLVTGVGAPALSFALGYYLGNHQIDLAINAGVGGSFSGKRPLGEVVEVVSERFGDLGVEEADGSFTDIHELELTPPDFPPFEKSCLINPGTSQYTFLPKTKGLTVNKVHGQFSSIALIKAKYEVDIESMEGAAFFYSCLLANVPFIEIRGISNYVEPRNRDNWKLELAIENLNKVLIKMINTLEE